jgi:hypothetical protein
MSLRGLTILIMTLGLMLTPGEVNSQASGGYSFTISNSSNRKLVFFYAISPEKLASRPLRGEIYPRDVKEFTCGSESVCYVRFRVFGSDRRLRLYPPTEYVFQRQSGRWSMYSRK